MNEPIVKTSHGAVRGGDEQGVALVDGIESAMNAGMHSVREKEAPEWIMH